MSGSAENPSPFAFYLDSMIFIFAVEGESTVSNKAKKLLEALRAKPATAITSELTLAEVLAGSERGLDPRLKRSYLDLMVWSKFLDLVPISRSILYETAKLRASHRTTHGKKLRLPDAIHLVTAIERKCSHFVSADEGIKLPAGMTKVAFDDQGVDEALRALSQ